MKPTRNKANPKSGRSKANGLEAYRAKRKFESTTEPKGEKSAGEDYIFVVQKHRARGLHYDLRLAMGGVLKSWALPRRPVAGPGRKTIGGDGRRSSVGVCQFRRCDPQRKLWGRGGHRMGPRQVPDRPCPI